MIQCEYTECVTEIHTVADLRSVRGDFRPVFRKGNQIMDTILYGACSIGLITKLTPKEPA